MKIRKFNLALVVLSVLLNGFTAQAAKGISYSMPAAEAGFRWNSASLSGAASNKQVIGFQLGVSTVLNFNEKLGLRTGLFYTERSFESNFVGSTGKGKITYFEVPAQLMLKLEDYAGVYVGPVVAVKLGDEYNAGALTGVKDIVVPVVFGAQFKFHPNIGANVFFEAVSGSLASGVDNSRAVGANLMFTLD
jgi:hypothetical protein